MFAWYLASTTTHCYTNSRIKEAWFPWICISVEPQDILLHPSRVQSYNFPQGTSSLSPRSPKPNCLLHPVVTIQLRSKMASSKFHALTTSQQVYTNIFLIPLKMFLMVVYKMRSYICACIVSSEWKHLTAEDNSPATDIFLCSCKTQLTSNMLILSVIVLITCCCFHTT